MLQIKKTCDICNKTFSSKFAKKRHTREVHDSTRTGCSKPTAVQCKECGVNFSRLNIYRQHLHQYHNIDTTRVKYEFASEKEFMAWKDGLELEVGVNYTTHAGNKKSVDGSKTIYYCRRSGVKKPSQSTDKRAEKSQGTSKMGYYCTSSIEVVKQNGCVQVTYYVEHHDHDVNFLSLVHMTLPAGVKDKIADMILHGISHEHILEQVRKSAGKTRAAILDSQDIKNVVAQFGLKQEVVEDGGNFLVCSASVKQKKYRVITRDLSCDKCKERCTYCNVCKCMYMCTCEDNDKGTRNICKHIHAVVLYKTQVAVANSPSKEIENSQDIVCNKMSTDSQPQNYGEQLMNHINSRLLPLCEEISDQEVFKAADDYIGKAVAILSAAKNLAISSSMFSVDLATKQEPASKHCGKQQKLYSAKRKRVDTGQGLTEPSKEMRQKIGERLSYLSQTPIPVNFPPQLIVKTETEESPSAPILAFSPCLP